MMTETQLPPAVRTLSESEIQKRLYGGYRGREKAPAPVQHPSSDSAWTGSEILSGELQRLRSELISLRQEKEQLAAKLRQVRKPQPSVVESQPQVGMGRWIGRVLGFVLLIGVLGYWVGAHALQASPSAGDFTPYTVQVAVYNGKQAATRARQLLNELGYDAFLVDIPRPGGVPRYRVYVGRFVTKEEAAQESQRLAADTRFQDFKDAFVLIR